MKLSEPIISGTINERKAELKDRQEGKAQAISEFKEKLINKVKEQSSFRVVRGEAGKQRIADFTEGEDVGRESERELVLKIIEKTAQEILRSWRKDDIK